MIRLKRYIKHKGELIGPKTEITLSSELEEKHVKSGAAEYIMPKVSSDKKVAENKKVVEEISVPEDKKNIQEVESQVQETKVTTVSDESENEEEANTSDLVSEDVSINFDEDEYASGSKKKRKK